MTGSTRPKQQPRSMILCWFSVDPATVFSSSATTPDSGQPAPFWGGCVRGQLPDPHRFRHIHGECGPLLSLIHSSAFSFSSACTSPIMLAFLYPILLDREATINIIGYLVSLIIRPYIFLYLSTFSVFFHQVRMLMLYNIQTTCLIFVGKMWDVQ